MRCNEKKEITKEYLIELIGMAELLESALEDMDAYGAQSDAQDIIWYLRTTFDKLCGEEELARMREDKL